MQQKIAKVRRIFQKMHIKGRVVSDVSKYESSMQITLYYNNKELLKGSIYVNKEYVAYNFPQVYSKPLYVKLSDAYANMPVQIDVNKYIKLLIFKTILSFKLFLQAMQMLFYQNLHLVQSYLTKKLSLNLAMAKRSL